jgi:hypothetical protein
MLARSKRILRPFRPVLRPVRLRWQAFADSATPYSIPNLVDGMLDRVRDGFRALQGRPAPSIRPLRHHEMVVLAAKVPYYRGRLGYLGVAGGAAADLIGRRQLRTALELGPGFRSLIVGADVMDRVAKPDLRAEARRVIHEATKAPWPIEDKAYDLFVALQVFEHLGTRQADAFREVRRVARNAILSLPIDWEMADPSNCHHRLSHERALTWFAPIVPTRVLVGNPGPRKRLIYVFEDLPAPGAPPDGTIDPAV